MTDSMANNAPLSSNALRKQRVGRLTGAIVRKTSVAVAGDKGEQQDLKRL